MKNKAIVHPIYTTPWDQASDAVYAFVSGSMYDVIWNNISAIIISSRIPTNNILETIDEVVYAIS